MKMSEINERFPSWRFNDVRVDYMNGGKGGGGGAAGAGSQGKTYYPVNPLGTFNGPRASDYPQGTATPTTTAPAPGTSPAPSTPPATASPTPDDNPARRMQRRLYSALLGDDSTAISSLPQGRQDYMARGWGVFGGGQPMPSTLGDFRSARRTYLDANPKQWPAAFGLGRY